MESYDDEVAPSASASTSRTGSGVVDAQPPPAAVATGEWARSCTLCATFLASLHLQAHSSACGLTRLQRRCYPQARLPPPSQLCTAGSPAWGPARPGSPRAQRGRPNSRSSQEQPQPQPGCGRARCGQASRRQRSRPCLLRHGGSRWRQRSVLSPPPRLPRPPLTPPWHLPPGPGWPRRWPRSSTRRHSTCRPPRQRPARLLAQPWAAGPKARRTARRRRWRLAAALLPRGRLPPLQQGAGVWGPSGWGL